MQQSDAEAEPTVLIRPTVVSDWTVSDAFAMGPESYTGILYFTLFAAPARRVSRAVSGPEFFVGPQRRKSSYGALARLAGQVA